MHYSELALTSETITNVPGPHRKVRFFNVGAARNRPYGRHQTRRLGGNY